jgi:predicted RNA-binding protein with EMAP domain
MILRKIHNENKDIDKNEDKSILTEHIRYQWISSENIVKSPTFNDLKDALFWIIKYDTPTQKIPQ